MATKEIQVTPSTLTSKASELKVLNGEFQKKVSELRMTEGKLNSMWEGDARKAFHKAFDDDVKQMDNFYNLIEKYVQGLYEIVREYNNVERTNADIAKKRSY